MCTIQNLVSKKAIDDFSREAIFKKSRVTPRKGRNFAVEQAEAGMLSIPE
jgi:hypothetical protein